MIVVDTNVIAYAYIQGDHTKWAHQLRDRDACWRLPSLWRHEFLNILSVYVAQGGFGLEQALQVWRRAAENVRPCEYRVNMAAALKLACTHKVAAYDAQFIALAQTLNVPCVTEDKALIRKFPDVAVSMKEFCSKK